MVFSSLLFLYAFLPVSMIVYKLCRGSKSKNCSLLVFSLIFYAWAGPKYLILLIFMSFSSWICALKVEEWRAKGKNTKFWVILSCIIDIALLAYFKYASFIVSIFGAVPAFIKNIALPLGISFYTFQLMTYVIDVYREDAKVQNSFLNVLLYAALFHQCVAGPIVRYGSIADELYAPSREEEMLPGIRRFTLGLAKKALLANACGILADAILLPVSVSENPSEFLNNFQILSGLTCLEAWIGIISYTLQIYLDFSAYSDMAIGMGKMIGLHYPENFDYPYISGSVREFWQRWHMTLGGFFRDYVYIPLGGSRCSKLKIYRNLFVVWALTGLWHGAHWNFLLWGIYYFVLLVLERGSFGKLLKKIGWFSTIYVLLAVTFGFALFRYSDLRLAGTFFKSLFRLNSNFGSDFISETVLLNNLFLLVFSCISCTPLIRNSFSYLYDIMQNSGVRALVGISNALRDFGLPVVLLLLSTAALVGDSYNPFLYFRF